MLKPENDISWSVLRRIAQEWAGAAAELVEVKPLTGGSVSTTLLLGLKDGARAVLKISPHRVNKEYAREAYQLNLLRQHGLPTPEVYACHIGTLDCPHSYLLMELMEGVNLQEARKQISPEQFDHLQMHLAEIVLAMHAQTASHYHRPGEEAETFESWPAFYRHVYDPIWSEVEKSPLVPGKSRKAIARVHGRLDDLLAHGDAPRLVHSDIWNTNVLAKADEHGRWWVSALLDPNCKFGHAEAEIAYLELFNTITPAFLRAYQQVHRLPEEYHRVRRSIYQLYPMIHHVHVFGNGYVKPLLSMVDRLGGVV